MDAAQTLFEQFKVRGQALVDELIDEGTQESLILDFKAARENKAPMLEDDRKTLAEAISGFANSDGGIIVWGVDCRKGPHPDDPDIAQSKKPIGNISRWLSDLNSYTPQVVSPAPIGIEHFIILEDRSQDSGYAVTYVPKSDGMPHMAIAKKKDQYCYFLRSGASFIKMEAYMVADRFGRRPSPQLNLHARVYVGMEMRSGGKHTREYKLVIGIENNGRGLAVYPSIRIQPLSPLQFWKYGIDGNGHHGLPRVKDSGSQGASQYFAGGISDVIHAGTVREITTLIYEANLLAPELISQTNLSMQYQLYCDGFAQSGVLEFCLGDVLSNGTVIAGTND
ncbi:hypothetical protein CCAX7_60410 [Capsulimonas corticalis]|uniref:Schlafen AlbA-2 domain-containing protein n=1 Tax=Capsulimonas corticalis TaxID=2219043 RepID=A0A402CW15_9BACT|nr:ATP-binding protein [Capsulimonas corticalis]BDI33990.1 hypothetical protein CCAX7_60410 [Capsulimonas corticalis]